MAEKINNILWSRQTGEETRVYFDPEVIPLTKSVSYDFRGSGTMIDFAELDSVDIYEAFYFLQEEFGEKYRGAIFFDNTYIELGIIKVLVNPALQRGVHPEVMLEEAAKAAVAILDFCAAKHS